MLNFLSFVVLLYVSGHFKQKKIFKIFQTDRKIMTCHQFMLFILDLKILQVFFKNRGENFSFLKNVEFFEFFGFILCFKTFQAKKNFSKFF